MSKLFEGALAAALALSLPFALVPTAATAQEEGQEQARQEQARQECSARLTPQQVEPGQKAVQLSVILSQPIGDVEELETADSGLELADPDDLREKTKVAHEEAEKRETEEEPAEMAREEVESPEPIRMSAEGNGAILWLNTEDAEPGTYDVTFRGAEGECAAHLTVKGEEPAEGEREPEEVTPPEPTPEQPGS